MTDEVIKRAIKLRDGLKSVAKEIGFRRPRTDAEKELNAMDQQTCLDAADMLQKLGTEVTRLRLAIGHFRYTRMNAPDLYRIAETWNEAKP